MLTLPSISITDDWVSFSFVWICEFTLTRYLSADPPDFTCSSSSPDSNFAPKVIITHNTYINIFIFLNYIYVDKLFIMNLVKTAIKVQLGLINPYSINPAHRMFTESQNNSIEGRLVERQKINYDSYVMRVDFGQQDKCLGLKIGQYAWLSVGGDKRPYVPISPIDQPGVVDFLIRDLRKNPESFTKHLLELPMNEKIKIEGPGTQFLYEGFGRISYNSQPVKKYKNIGIITHASGITTSYSLIESIAMNHDNQTGISLLWLGDRSEDFVFVNQLSSYVEQCKLNMNLMLCGFEKGWVGPYGTVNTTHLEEFLPFPSDDTFIIMSALEGPLEEIKRLVQERGYKNYIYV